MMVGGAVAALFAMAMVGLALIGLIVLAFYNKRLALFGFVALLAFIMYPIAASHISYAFHARGTPYDHIRQEEGGSYGVTLPDDRSLVRSPRRWTSDPAGSLGFTTQLPGTDHTVFFNVSRIIQVEEDGTIAGALGDWSDCPSTQTETGLIYIAPNTCPEGSSWERDFHSSGHVLTTPPDADIAANFYSDPFSDPDEIQGVYMIVGPYRIWASGRGMPIDLWQDMLAHIATQVDQHFTLIESP